MHQHIIGKSPNAGLNVTAAAAAGGATAVAADAPSSNSLSPAGVVSFGYDTDIEAKYEWGEQIGKGGNGVVRVVTDRASGEQYACKSISKALPPGDQSISDRKRAGHVAAIQREVDVMRRLAGSLAVVRLVDVFEDAANVYIVQEWCKGGELHHRINAKHYSERTVSPVLVRGRWGGGGGGG